MPAMGPAAGQHSSRTLALCQTHTRTKTQAPASKHAVKADGNKHSLKTENLDSETSEQNHFQNHFQ